MIKGIENWSVEKSKSLYGVENWGDGYFSINDSGNVSIYPRGCPGPAVDLLALVEQCKTESKNLPILLRFNDILRHRVMRLCGAFESAMKEANYCLLYTSPSPRDKRQSRMPSSA